MMSTSDHLNLWQDYNMAQNDDININVILPNRNTSEEMQLVTKNDEHNESLVNDPVFFAKMQERNEQANQLMNLNNHELTKAGYNAAQNAEVLIANTNEHWINTKWRPMMGWLYLAVCLFDFILFPIAWSVFQAVASGSVTTPWQPLSLQGAGLFHVAMGAVLGIAVYGRTREKIEEVAKNG